MPDKMYRILLDDYACPSFCSFTKPYLGTHEEIDAFIAEYAKHRKDALAKKKGSHLSQLLALYEEQMAYPRPAKTGSDPKERSLFDENGMLTPEARERLSKFRPKIPVTEDGKIDYDELAMGYGRIAESLASTLYQQEHDEHTYDGAWKRFCEGEGKAKVLAAMGLWTFVEDVEIAAERSLPLVSNEAEVENIHACENLIRWSEGEARVCWFKTYEEEGGNQDGTGRIRQEAYLRAMKLSFTEFSMFSCFSQRWEFPERSWGVPGTLEMVPADAVTENVTRADGKTVEIAYAPKGDISTRLWIVDKRFATEEEMLFDVKARGDGDMDLHLSLFWQEIVADG